MPDNPLYRARYLAHVAFDRLWDYGDITMRRKRRRAAYRWLRAVTGMNNAECHFSLFDIGVCEAIVALVRQVEGGMIDGP